MWVVWGRPVRVRALEKSGAPGRRCTLALALNALALLVGRSSRLILRAVRDECRRELRPAGQSQTAAQDATTPVLSRKTRAKKTHQLPLAWPKREAVAAGQTALAQHERVRVPTCRHHLKARLAGSRRLPATLCQAAAVSSPPAGPRPQRTRVPVIVKRKYKKM